MLTSDTLFLIANENAAEGQDKDRVSRDRSASSEAYRTNAAFQSNNSELQPADRDGDPYALVPFTIQCKRYVKQEVHEIAKKRSSETEEKVSDSSVGAELLEQMVHHKANLHHTTFLEPTLTRLFERKFTEFFNRYLGITARNTYNLHQILAILTNFVPLYIGDATFDQILKEAETSKRVDITRRSEQVNEVYNILKQEIFGKREDD